MSAQITGGSPRDAPRHRATVPIAWSIAGVALATVFAAVALGGDLLFAISWVVPTGLLGAFLVSRRPRSLVGWFLLAGAASFAVMAAAESYLAWAFAVPEAPRRGGGLAAWASQWVWIPAWTLTFVGIALVFPEDRLPSRRWRPVAVAAAVFPALQLIGLALYPGPLGGRLEEGTLAILREEAGLVIPNPVGIDGAAPLFDLVLAVAEVAALLLMVAALVALVARHRNGSPTVRLQVRWLLLVAAGFVGVMGFAAVAATTGWDADRVAGWIMPVVVVGYPVAIFVAVTRYRLYEVDRILKRSAVYALVSAVLIGLYATSVFVFQELLASLTTGGDLAVAASTLAVAAAFGPVRRRAQRAVDRRFDRSRYDAQRAIGAFAQRLRHEVDIELLTTDVCEVVRSTVHPRAVALWLPEGAVRS